MGAKTDFFGYAKPLLQILFLVCDYPNKNHFFELLKFLEYGIEYVRY